MSRPRWHDALIVSAIVGLLAVGIWSLWGEDVRTALHLAPAAGSDPAPASVAAGQTSGQT